VCERRAILDSERFAREILRRPAQAVVGLSQGTQFSCGRKTRGKDLYACPYMLGFRSSRTCTVAADNSRIRMYTPTLD
jgi:hypothetical protein